MALNLGTFNTDLKAALLRAQVLYHSGKKGCWGESQTGGEATPCSPLKRGNLCNLL